MLDPHTIVLFFGASALLALSPGPDNLFVLTQSALQGWRGGVLVTLGLCTGLLVHTLAVTLGVAAIFETSDIAFTGLKWIGALYLVYLAWRAFTSAPEASGESRSDREAAALYRRGVVMNLTNPKVALFFLAFLPQFTDPGQGALMWQLMQLGAVFVAATILFSAVSRSLRVGWELGCGARHRCNAS